MDSIRRRKRLARERKMREKNGMLEAKDLAGTHVIKIDGKRKELIKRRIKDKKEHLINTQTLETAIVQEKELTVKAQGKLDGLVEMIAEEEGVDFKNVNAWSYDDDTDNITLTMLAVVPDEEKKDGKEPAGEKKEAADGEGEKKEEGGEESPSKKPEEVKPEEKPVAATA